MRFGCLIASLLLLPSGLLAQAPAARYLPLEVGNTWSYFQIQDPPGAPPDTLWRETYAITETVSVNDTLYYRAGYPFPLADTLRADSEGKIWARIHDRDLLLFDFTLAEGATYRFQTPRKPDVDFRVSMERPGTVEVGAGRFEDVVLLQFDDPQVVDEERTFAFAPGVGIVYAYGTLGDYEELYAAEVGGEVITHLERDEAPTRVVPRGFAYPNPSGGVATVVLPSNGSLRAEAVVYDAQGRRRATLRDGACDRERCVFTWDASLFANGMYFLRLEGEGETTTLVLAR